MCAALFAEFLNLTYKKSENFFGNVLRFVKCRSYANAENMAFVVLEGFLICNAGFNLFNI